MSSLIIRQHKYRSLPTQPVDRHLSEIGESDGTIYINAGIDSTCCKKRSQTIHKLVNGIVVSTETSPTSTTKTRSLSEHHDDLSPVSLNTSIHHDRCDSINNSGCVFCGK